MPYNIVDNLFKSTECFHGFVDLSRILSTMHSYLQCCLRTWFISCVVCSHLPLTFLLSMSPQDPALVCIHKINMYLF